MWLTLTPIGNTCRRHRMDAEPGYVFLPSRPLPRSGPVPPDENLRRTVQRPSVSSVARRSVLSTVGFLALIRRLSFTNQLP